MIRFFGLFFCLIFFWLFIQILSSLLPKSGNPQFLSQKKFLPFVDQQLIIGNKGQAINQKFRPWIDKVNLDQRNHNMRERERERERERLRVVPFNWPPWILLQPPCLYSLSLVLYKSMGFHVGENHSASTHGGQNQCDVWLWRGLARYLLSFSQNFYLKSICFLGK